jgi:hypothetical protein
MENTDTDLTVPEGIPCTPEEIIKEIPRHSTKNCLLLKTYVVKMTVMMMMMTTY